MPAVDRTALQQRGQGAATKALRGKPMSTLSHEAPSGIELDALYWDAGGQGAELTIEPGWPEHPERTSSVVFTHCGVWKDF